MKGDISVRPTQMSRPVKVDHLQIFPKYFGRTELKRLSLGFASEAFGNFMSKNGILQEKRPPVHPLSRGLGVFSKMGWKSGKDWKVHCTARLNLAEFFFTHWSKPQTITRVIPAELMFNCHSLIWLWSCLTWCKEAYQSSQKELHYNARTVWLFSQFCEL